MCVYVVDTMCRNSKLTQLLADSLSGQAKVMMFLHVAPETSSHNESVSTLKFGSRVSEITLGQASKNIERGSPLEVREAQVRPPNSGSSHHQEFVPIILSWGGICGCGRCWHNTCMQRKRTAFVECLI